MLTVGIPREIKPLEKRVGLVPSHVAALTRLGIPVVVEKRAGESSGFSDEAYQKAGARILPDAKSIYQAAGLIQKVKEPLPAEYSLLRAGQILFCFLHLASPENYQTLRSLMRAGATAVGYETLEVKGKLPILIPMSEIAGALASAYASYFMSLSLISKGLKALPENRLSVLEKIAEAYPNLLPHAPLGNVVIFGGGVAGKKALEFSLRLTQNVIIIEKNSQVKGFLKEQYPEVQVFSSLDTLEHLLSDADVLIGCIHVKGQRALRVMDQEFLGRISTQKKKIIMDVSIDQGGNFPEARAMSYENPLYQDRFGNIRFAVANIPSLCGRFASEALSEQSYHYTLAMADHLEDAFRELPELAQAVNIHQGQIVLGVLREAHEKQLSEAFKESKK